MDFTIKSYQSLLNSLIQAEFNFQTFDQFLINPKERAVILRHDVDLLPQNSLRFAKIQTELGIKGSYYFRAVPESWDEEVIKEIAGLGHEVGYHYENMDAVYGKAEVLSDKAEGLSDKAEVEKGSTEYEKLLDLAYEDFCENLEKLRKLVPVSTICMHGSPRSQFDNKAIWDKYDYKKLGIIGEPYYDVDFDKVFYLTDTGRRWDGWKTSVRDKVPQQEEWIKQGLVFHSTQDIIDALGGSLSTRHERSRRVVEVPSQVMFTMHPQRWHDSSTHWFKELILQNAKNVVKRILYVK